MAADDDIATMTTKRGIAEGIRSNIQAEITELTTIKTQISDIARDVKSAGESLLRGGVYKSENSIKRNTLIAATADGKLYKASEKIYEYIRDTLTPNVSELDGIISGFDAAINSVRTTGKTADSLGFGSYVNWTVPSKFSEWNR